jgi:biofilm protein TabA
MILFGLNNTEQISNVAGLPAALDFLRNCHTEMPDGTVEIDGKNVFAMIQSYETRQERNAPRFEAHRKYIDIQFLLSGTELMGWAPLDAVTVTEPYDAEKDILFGNVADDASAFTFFSAGQAIVLFPSDAHAPGLTKGKPRPVKKVVIKIRVGSHSD